MNKRCGTYRALPTGVGLLFLVAAAIANGCASGDVAEQPGDASSDAATEDLRSYDARSVYTCTLGQGLIRGSLEVFTSPGDQATCRVGASEPPRASRRYCTGGPGDNVTCPDCYALQKSLECLLTL
jgi:hypothetical protein